MKGEWGKNAIPDVWTVSVMIDGYHHSWTVFLLKENNFIKYVFHIFTWLIDP